MWTAAAILAFLALASGAALGWLSRRYAPSGDSVTDRIDALLPQTQCAQCGYPGCRPYAEAIARGEAPINLCPPGGEQTVHSLARLLEVDPPRLENAREEPLVAFIDEQRCIGCTLCIEACPVDAIVGARQYMHTVLEDHCTGCELCIAPCPVDCIELRPPQQPSRWIHPAPPP